MEETVPVALLESILKSRPGSDKYQIREILFGLGYSYTTRQINRSLYGLSDRFHSAKGIGAAPLWHLYPPSGQDPSSVNAELKTLFPSHSPTSGRPTLQTPAIPTPIITFPSSGVGPSTTKPNSPQPIPQVPAEPAYNKGLEEVRKRKWLREMSRSSDATWFLSSNLVTQELLRDIRAQIELGVDDDDDDDQVELGDETEQMSWRDERDDQDETD